MRTGHFAVFEQSAIVLFGRRWGFAVWLVLTAGSAVGGWYFGRGHSVAENTPEKNVRITSSRPREAVFATDSPKGRWMQRVKTAAPADFPRLQDESYSLFGDVEDLEGQPINAMRWFQAQWLVRDREGFLKALATGDIQMIYWAAPVIVQLDPGLAVDLLDGKGEIKLGSGLTDAFASELAKCQPDLYLKLDPGGTKDFTPGRSYGDESWNTALRTLAKADPVAAATAWQQRKLENHSNTLLSALLPVFEAWNEGNPPLKEWANQITDPELRDLAHHARIMAMARKDPHAALTELYATPLRQNNDLRENAPNEVLTQLAKQDLPAALRLMKETSALFALPRETSSNGATGAPFAGDPFADSPQESPASPPAPEPTPSGPPPNPFIALAPYEGNTPESNWVRSTILRVAAEHLPDQPDAMFASLRKVRAEMGGDSAWQRQVEAQLISNACTSYSAEACLTVTKLWASELNGAADDTTFQSLAARAAKAAPEMTAAALDNMPEAARAAFAAEIIKNLPADEPESRLALLEQLTPAQWDETLGRSLGEHGADYADAMATLPGATTAGAREGFMKEWAIHDPDAAAQWFAALPQDDNAAPAAQGLFNGWSDFDKSAAIAWAESLPAGPARKAVALDVARTLAAHSPGEAWHWAATITNLEHRARAYNTISSYHDDEPAAFQQEHEAALRAAGME